MKRLLASAIAVITLASAGTAWAARDYVWAAGSSTVFPYTTRVAETYARKTGSRTPKVESLGTGGGIKLFCGGAGDAFPDIANASRPMKKSEYEACQKNGVTDILEIKVGYDGIVVAMDKRAPDFNLKLEHLFLALSSETLRQGRLQKNPYLNQDPGLRPAADQRHPRRLPGAWHRGRRCPLRPAEVDEKGR